MQRIRQIVAVWLMTLGLSGQPALAHDTPLEEFFGLVATGSLEAVAEALEHEPDLAVKTDTYGFSAVHVLDYLGFEKKLALLQRYGANVNAQNDVGHGILHVIIDPTLIAAAVAAGADPNLRDHQQRTPIMLFLLEPDAADFVPAFIAAGVDVNARDAKGVSVLGYAEEFNDPTLIRMLERAGARP